MKRDAITRGITHWSSFQVVPTMSEELMAALYNSDSLVVPDILGGQSEIFNEPEDRRELAKNLTPRAEGYVTSFFSVAMEIFFLCNFFQLPWKHFFA
jgi:hypothetical protein